MDSRHASGEGTKQPALQARTIRNFSISHRGTRDGPSLAEAMDVLANGPYLRDVGPIVDIVWEYEDDSLGQWNTFTVYFESNGEAHSKTGGDSWPTSMWSLVTKPASDARHVPDLFRRAAEVVEAHHDIEFLTTVLRSTDNGEGDLVFALDLYA